MNKIYCPCQEHDTPVKKFFCEITQYLQTWNPSWTLDDTYYVWDKSQFSFEYRPDEDMFFIFRWELPVPHPTGGDVSTLLPRHLSEQLMKEYYPPSEEESATQHLFDK